MLSFQKKIMYGRLEVEDPVVFLPRNVPRRQQRRIADDKVAVGSLEAEETSNTSLWMIQPQQEIA
jgi:hypothetical protein